MKTTILYVLSLHRSDKSGLSLLYWLCLEWAKSFNTRPSPIYYFVCQSITKMTLLNLVCFLLLLNSTRKQDSP